MAIPAESGPRSDMVTSMSDSRPPSSGSSLGSFRKSPTIPHILLLSTCLVERLGSGKSEINLREQKFPHRKQFLPSVAQVLATAVPVAFSLCCPCASSSGQRVVQQGHTR